MKYIAIFLLLGLALSACTEVVTQPIPKVEGKPTIEQPEENPIVEEPVQEELEEEPIVEEPALVPNKAELIQTCNSLCKEDREAYCIQERMIVFDDLSYTEGNCRVFAKYVKQGFSKCEGFCETYGKETGCTIDGKTDRKCDG